MAKVLIAGGTGMIGSRLAPILKERGHQVNVLSRQKGAKNAFFWDPQQSIMDASALEGTDVIVHLAGVSLDKGRWTEKTKRSIVDSRVKSARLLFDTIQKHRGTVKAFISAAAVGLYGNGEAWVDESHPAGEDFLAQTCMKWEAEAHRMETLGLRAVCIRTGVVLDREEGMLPVLRVPVKWGLAAGLGSANPYLSWIHISDLCGIYIMAIEEVEMRGAYNAVAPQPARQKEFMRALCISLHRPFWLPDVPAWALKMALGEKAMLVLNGQRVSAKKIMDAGYDFKFKSLDEALKDLTQSR